MFLYGWHIRAPYPERLLVPLSLPLGRDLKPDPLQEPESRQMLDDALGCQRARAGQEYSQIQKLIVEDAPMVFLYHAIRMAAYADRVQGLELNLAALPHDKLVKVDLGP
jgi:hypothetical protein